MSREPEVACKSMTYLFKVLIISSIYEHQPLDRFCTSLITSILLKSSLNIITHSYLNAVGVASNYINPALNWLL